VLLLVLNLYQMQNL